MRRSANDGAVHAGAGDVSCREGAGHGGWESLRRLALV